MQDESIPILLLFFFFLSFNDEMIRCLEKIDGIYHFILLDASYVLHIYDTYFRVCITCLLDHTSYIY